MHFLYNITNCVTNVYTDVDECIEMPGLCLNNGKCVNGQGNFTCNCTDGYMGEYCENG